MTKSSKLFLISSGVYLFLLTFMLLTQPRSGYSATVEDVLSYYKTYLPLWVGIGILFFIALRYPDKNRNKLIFGKRTLLCVILISILVGFAFNFDYLRQSGCFNEDELMFSATKFVFSVSSVLLLSSGYYFSNSKTGKFLLIAEFFIWTFKALYFNGTLDLNLPGYFTMTCWALRVLLICKVLNQDTVWQTASDNKNIG